MVRPPWPLGLYLLVASAAAVLPACADDAGSGPPDDGAACPGQTLAPNADGVPVIRCARFFDAPPLVRAPADAGGVYYGALAEGALVTRDGVHHPLFEADGTTTIECTLGGGLGPTMGWSPGCAAAVWAPTHKLGVRSLYTVYAVTATPLDAGHGLAVTAIKPYLMASAEALASLLERPFEGTGNLRLVPFPGPDTLRRFDPERTARLRLEPIGRKPAQPLAIGAEEGNPDQVDLPVLFRVVNLRAPTRAADGACLPSLGSLGPANPFDTGTTDTLRMGRFANMHGVGDHHLVMSSEDADDTGIATALGGSMDVDDRASVRAVVNPARWLAPDLDLGADLAMTQLIHGTPNGFSLALTPAGPAPDGACP